MSSAEQTGELDVWRAEAVTCRDPECDGTADPEQDGDHRYFECTTCGYAFGHERVPETVLAEDADGSCSVGIPASVRRAASAPFEAAMAAERKAAPVDLGLTIGRRTT